jgi:hypothetical protein
VTDKPNQSSWSRDHSSETASQPNIIYRSGYSALTAQEDRLMSCGKDREKILIHMSLLLNNAKLAVIKSEATDARHSESVCRKITSTRI